MKTLLAYQVQKVEYKGIFPSMIKIASTQGFFALYKGLGFTLMVTLFYFIFLFHIKGIAPYASLKLTFYQILKNWFYYSGDVRSISTSANLVFGALAGCMAVTITYPTDLLRRRVQIHVVFLLLTF